MQFSIVGLLLGRKLSSLLLFHSSSHHVHLLPVHHDCIKITICPFLLLSYPFLSMYSYSEELSRCQEEVRRLQSSLASARDDCVGVSDERLQLQQENLQLRREMDELRKATLLAQKNAKQQVTE